MRIDLKIALYCLFTGIGIAIIAMVLPMRYPHINSLILDFLLYVGILIALGSFMLICYELFIKPNHAYTNKTQSSKIIISLQDLSSLKAKGHLIYKIVLNNISDQKCIVESVRMMTLLKDGLKVINQEKYEYINETNNYNGLFDKYKYSKGSLSLKQYNTIFPKTLEPQEIWIYEHKEPFNLEYFVKNINLPHVKRIPVTLSILFIDFKGRSFTVDLGFYAEIKALDNMIDYNTSSHYIQHEIILD